ncbi:MAG: zinc dependent phospholipase C family protein [Deltaproteobacteria bacterium]|nr:zinc dependent phospholipase C family protein [Deltaproteobacteria bacterium]
MVLTAVVLLVVLLVMPDAADAWGPATHLELALTALNNASVVSAPVRSLIEHFPYDFLYGNISADIYVGKNLVEELKHCHNWKAGFALLKNAKSGSQRAFAYGYLSHLAADTVAHNHFIPERMLRSFSARTLRHVYWEMRADALADKRVWRLPKRIAAQAAEDNDALLNATIEGAPLSFRTNKTIFSSIMSINRMKHWHRMLDLLSVTSRWSLDKQERELHFNDSLDAIMGLLKSPLKAPCLKKDPIGRLNLALASTARKRLRAMKKAGLAWEEALSEELAKVAP